MKLRVLLNTPLLNSMLNQTGPAIELAWQIIWWQALPCNKPWPKFSPRNAEIMRPGVQDKVRVLALLASSPDNSFPLSFGLPVCVI